MLLLFVGQAGASDRLLETLLACVIRLSVCFEKLAGGHGRAAVYRKMSHNDLQWRFELVGDASSKAIGHRVERDLPIAQLGNEDRIAAQPSGEAAKLVPAQRRERI